MRRVGVSFASAADNAAATCRLDARDAAEIRRPAAELAADAPRGHSGPWPATPQGRAFTAGSYHVINRAILRIAKCFFDRRSRDGRGLGSGVIAATSGFTQGSLPGTFRRKRSRSKNADGSLIFPRMSGKTLREAKSYLLPMLGMAG